MTDDFLHIKATRIFRVASNLSLATWPGEKDAIAYQTITGDLHLLSSQARSVIESLLKSDMTTEELETDLEKSLSGSEEIKDIFDYHIPYLHRLGLLQVNAR